MEIILFYTIYKTTNLINGKVYIGKHKTKNPNDNYLGSGKDFNHAKELHGVENFKKEVLFVFSTEEEMDAKEAELVNWDFVKEDDNYNLCPGGKGGWGFINENAELRKKASLAARLKLNHLYENDEIWKEQTSKKVSYGLKKKYLTDIHHSLGSKHTEETKQKMRKSKNKGDKNPNFDTVWITNGIENRQINKNLDLPKGWKQGRILNKRWIFSESERKTKMISINESLPLGWQEGRKISFDFLDKV